MTSTGLASAGPLSLWGSCPIGAAFLLEPGRDHRPFDELDASYLCGRLVTVGRSLLDPNEAPWVEHEEQRLTLRPVDARANAKRGRKSQRARRGIDAVSFDPNQARLHALVR